jgi:hypothetical protein
LHLCQGLAPQQWFLFQPRMREGKIHSFIFQPLCRRSAQNINLVLEHSIAHINPAFNFGRCPLNAAY